VSMIEKAAERAAGLTRQLLAFSRKQEKEVRAIDSAELLTGMSRLLKRILGEDIVLNSQAAPGLPTLLADPSMIEQVIMNLAVNSRDAMPVGGQLNLAVSAVSLDEESIPQHPGGRPGNFLQFEITDTGTGIAPEHLALIFEPFFTTKETGKGTGLGLATVFGIVKLHEGWIEVTSQLGHGTCFRVFLPVIETNELKQTVSRIPTKPRRGSETILITEDEEPIRRLMQIALERYGYRVLTAENGAEAVRILVEEGTKADLLVTDMVMPGGMNGRELAEKVHAFHPKLKVIYVSGFTSDKISRELCLVSGVNFLQKPFSIHALVEAVRRQLDNPQAEAKVTDAMT